MDKVKNVNEPYTQNIGDNVFIDHPFFSSSDRKWPEVGTLCYRCYKPIKYLPFVAPRYFYPNISKFDAYDGFFHINCARSWILEKNWSNSLYSIGLVDILASKLYVDINEARFPPSIIDDYYQLINQNRK